MMRKKMTQNSSHVGTICRIRSKKGSKNKDSTVILYCKETEIGTGPKCEFAINTTDFLRLMFYFKVEKGSDMFGAKIRFSLVKIRKGADHQIATASACMFKVDDGLLIEFQDILTPGFGGQAAAYSCNGKRLEGKFVRIQENETGPMAIDDAKAELYLDTEAEGNHVRLVALKDLCII